MKHNGIADPGQLAMLTRVLNDYCGQRGILANSPEREHLAATLIALYESGVTDDIQLAASLSVQNPGRKLLLGGSAQATDGAIITSTITDTVRR